MSVLMENIKIVMLKNKQHIICKLTELMVEETDEPLCFLFEVPMVISYTYPQDTVDDNAVTIIFQQWSPFSKSLQFRVPFDYVISIGEPKDQILEKYIETVEPYYSVINNPEFFSEESDNE